VASRHGITRAAAISDEKLTDQLVQTVLGWNAGPDRFTMSRRRWLPRWRFQPTKNIADAFRLLAAATIVEYALHAVAKGVYWVKVRTNGASAKASGSSLPLTICIAIARVHGIDVEVYE
jgi:hypothetical protein